MDTQLKIAFGGRMGTGKDTAVSYLLKNFGGEQISFATPIYDILHYAQKRCGFPPEKDRKFLQYIGADWARIKDDNVWIRLALDAVPQKGNVFISDLRFMNEFRALKNSGWTCVLLKRAELDESRVGNGSHLHVSETALDCIPDDEWSAVIHNNDTVEQFYEQIRLLVQPL